MESIGTSCAHRIPIVHMNRSIEAATDWLDGREQQGDRRMTPVLRGTDKQLFGPTGCWCADHYMYIRMYSHRWHQLWMSVYAWPRFRLSIHPPLSRAVCTNGY